MNIIERLSSKAICAIIESCGKHGVKRIRLGELDIDFSGEVGQPSQGHIPTGPWDNLSDHTTAIPAEMGSQEEETQAFSLQDRKVLEHVEEANLFLEDPSAWERQHLDEIIERDRLSDS